MVFASKILNFLRCSLPVNEQFAQRLHLKMVAPAPGATWVCFKGFLTPRNGKMDVRFLMNTRHWGPGCSGSCKRVVLLMVQKSQTTTWDVPKTWDVSWAKLLTSTGEFTGFLNHQSLSTLYKNQNNPLISTMVMNLRSRFPTR